jgi:hypothetical protein
MAIAINGASIATNVYNNVAGTSDSLTVADGSGTQRLAIAQVNVYNAFGGGVISSITLNGVPMTLAVDVSVVVSATLFSSLYFLKDADIGSSGAKTLTISYSGGAFTQVVVNRFYLTGVNQAAPIGATSTATSSLSTSGTITNNLNTLHNNSWVLDPITKGTNTSSTVGAGQVEIYDSNTSNSSGAGSYKATTTSGTIPMATTFASAVAGYAQVLAEIREGAAAGSDIAYFFSRMV